MNSLVSFRVYRKLQPEDIAKKLGLSLESYMDIEMGRVEIDTMLAEMLSEIYQAPKEIFLNEITAHHLQAEVIYANCTFINGTGSSSGYINNQYNDRGIDEILFAKKEEIKSLAHQIEQLHEQNLILIKLLGKSAEQIYS